MGQARWDGLGLCAVVAPPAPASPLMSAASACGLGLCWWHPAPEVATELAPAGTVLPHPAGTTALLGHPPQSGSQEQRGWVLITKELSCGCMFTLKDVTTMQLSVDIDKEKCGLEAFYNVKIGCDSNHLSYCSKTA